MIIMLPGGSNVFKKNVKRILSDNKAIPLAKPRRDFVYNYGKGTLKINVSTMDLLMYISPFVDFDGRINIPIEDVPFEIAMNRGTFENALAQAKEQKLIIQQGDLYYSKVHIITDGSNGKFDYVKLLPVYTSPSVYNYTLRESRLFYYFYSVTRLGQWHNISIYNLYKNQRNTEGNGPRYFREFREVANTLLKLMSNGHIEVKLRKANVDNSFSELILNSENGHDYNQKSFYDFFSYSDVTRKIRPSYEMFKNHVIQVRVPKHIHKEELKVQASKSELYNYINHEHIPFHEFNSTSINYVINYKNNLFKAAGTIGLEIYRKSIQAYISDHSHSLLYYDVKGKLANYFMDFYLLKEIQNILTAAALQNVDSASILNEDDVLTCHGYEVSVKTLSDLLHFFNTYASVNHKVLFDRFFFVNHINYDEMKFNHDEWLQFEKVVQKEYKYKWNQYEKYEAVIDKNIVSYNDWREFMTLIAEQDMFLKEEKYFKIINKLVQLQEIRVKKVKFYNWLEERETYPS